jgi:hypothetical protein
MNVTPGQLDAWRAFAEQTRTDMFTVRQLLAGGQGKAAAPLIAAVIENTIIVGLDMEGAGAARPTSLPPIPAGEYVDEDDA